MWIEPAGAGYEEELERMVQSKVESGRGDGDFELVRQLV